MKLLDFCYLCLKILPQEKIVLLDLAGLLNLIEFSFKMFYNYENDFL